MSFQTAVSLLPRLTKRSTELAMPENRENLDGAPASGGGEVGRLGAGAAGGSVGDATKSANIAIESEGLSAAAVS